MPGNVPAQMTAKIVIASEKRLIAVRHFWRKRNKIAEIKVPAWPMPTQNTKLVMSNAHITGCMLPHTPTPVPMRYRINPPKMPAHIAEITNAMYHAMGGLGDSFTQVMSRVTEAKSV